MHSFQVDGSQIAKTTSTGITIGSLLAAIQAWVQSQSYLTTSTLSSITVTGTSTLKAMNIDNGPGNSIIIT